MRKKTFLFLLLGIPFLALILFTPSVVKAQCPAGYRCLSPTAGLPCPCRWVYGGVGCTIDHSPGVCCTRAAVTLYENTNYGGGCLSLLSDDSNLTDNTTTHCFGHWSDCASSIRVEASYNAIIWESTGPGGNNYRVNSDISDLGTISMNGGDWDDAVSAIQVVAVGAGPGGGGTEFENPITATTVAEVIDNIADFIFNVAIVLAPLMVIIGAFLYATSGGNVRQVEQAKKLIFWTVIGFIVILFAKGITDLIEVIIG